MSIIPTDTLFHISQFCDQPTLYNLRRISKTFSESEHLLELLFSKRCPHPHITTTNWKQLYFSRCQAERNMLNGLYQIKTVYTIPPQATNQQIFTSPHGRQLVSYELNNTLIIQDLQQTTPISLPLTTPSFYTIQENNLLLSTPTTLTVYKLENTLTPITSYPCTAIATSIRLIPSPDPQSFWIAATFGIHNLDNPLPAPPQLKIWSHNSPDPHTLDLPLLPAKSVIDQLLRTTMHTITPIIIQSYSDNNTPFIILKQDSDLAIYDILTLNKHFALKRDWVPGHNTLRPLNEIDAKILQTAKSTIVLIVEEYHRWIYEPPQLPTTQTLDPIYKAEATVRGFAYGWDCYKISDLFFLKGVPSFISIHSPSTYSYVNNRLGPRDRDIYMHSLSSDPTIESVSENPIVLQTNFNVKISEQNGLPTLLLEDGKQIKTLNFNFTPPSFLDKWGKTLRNITLLVLAIFLAFKAKALSTKLLRLFSPLRLPAS